MGQKKIAGQRADELKGARHSKKDRHQQLLQPQAEVVRGIGSLLNDRKTLDIPFKKVNESLFCWLIAILTQQMRTSLTSFLDCKKFMLESGLRDGSTELFPFMKIRKAGDTKRSREMEFHGLRFMQVLESVITAIDNPATLDPLCDNLGRVHGRLTDSRGFKAHHWGVFIECTLFHFRRVLGSIENRVESPNFLISFRSPKFEGSCEL
ncbi:globin [Teladorsagia circumcincta]|uniref:Globin n=1 Tax=Teladorsagia circumcincta TaxID=45464 RepID=A0A2G9U5H0_TELCI|nr:globin [Teladorsagia circumcincta]